MPGHFAGKDVRKAEVSQKLENNGERQQVVEGTEIAERQAARGQQNGQHLQHRADPACHQQPGYILTNPLRWLHRELSTRTRSLSTKSTVPAVATRVPSFNPLTISIIPPASKPTRTRVRTARPLESIAKTLAFSPNGFMTATVGTASAVFSIRTRMKPVSPGFNFKSGL